MDHMQGGEENMSAIITVAVDKHGFNYSGGAVITDENGKQLAEAGGYYPESNQIYAAYKVLLMALSLCRGLGIDDVVIEEGTAKLYRELTGRLGKNRKLYTMFRELVTDYGISYQPAIPDAESARYKAAQTIAARMLVTRKTYSKITA